MAQFSLEIHQKKKPETSRYIKKFQALFCLNWKFTVQSASSYGRVRKAVQTRKENPFHSRPAQRCRRIGTYQLFRRPSGSLPLFFVNNKAADSLSLSETISGFMILQCSQTQKWHLLLKAGAIFRHSRLLQNGVIVV